MKKFYFTEFIMGIGLGIFLLSLVHHNADRLPVEVPLIIHCSSFGSDLKSYDATEFECTNGATFQREILVK